MRFERSAIYIDVKIHPYQTDNEIYYSDEFLKELLAKGQGIKMSGVSDQFQNGAAASIIKSEVQSARTMMLHANLRLSARSQVLQYDYFETVHSTEGSPQSPELWERLYNFNRSQVDWKMEPPNLAVEWMSPGERHARRERQQESHGVHQCPEDIQLRWSQWEQQREHHQ